jgi:hypothetical protein
MQAFNFLKARPMYARQSSEFVEYTLSDLDGVLSRYARPQQDSDQFGVAQHLRTKSGKTFPGAFGLFQISNAICHFSILHNPSSLCLASRLKLWSWSQAVVHYNIAPKAR